MMKKLVALLLSIVLCLMTAAASASIAGRDNFYDMRFNKINPYALYEVLPEYYSYETLQFAADDKLIKLESTIYQNDLPQYYQTIIYNENSAVYTSEEVSNGSKDVYNFYYEDKGSYISVTGTIFTGEIQKKLYADKYPTLLYDSTMCTTFGFSYNEKNQPSDVMYDSIVQNFIYDSKGRITKVTYEESGNIDDMWTITYDDVNRTALASDGDSYQIKFYYDAQDKLIKREYFYDSNAISNEMALKERTDYSYDNLGRLQTMTNYKITNTGVEVQQLDSIIKYYYEDRPAVTPAPSVPSTGDSFPAAGIAAVCACALLAAVLLLKKRSRA